MSDLMQFIPQELIILLVCTPIVGELLKTNVYTKKIIPIALFIFDILFSILLLRDFSALVILQGIAVWGIAIAGYDSFKSIKKNGGK